MIIEVVTRAACDSIVATIGDPAMAHDSEIHIRIPVEEKRRLMELARERGLTLSKFLRNTATEAAMRVAA